MKNKTVRVKEFADKQMNAMWHNQSAFKTTGMIKFYYKGYVVVNPWMDEKTEKPVNPYKYYGTKKTKAFIKKVLKRLNEEKL